MCCQECYAFCAKPNTCGWCAWIGMAVCSVLAIIFLSVGYSILNGPIVWVGWAFLITAAILLCVPCCSCAHDPDHTIQHSDKHEAMSLSTTTV
jgi:hypothetical protein